MQTMKHSASVILCTAPDIKIAHSLAQLLLKHQLAACVNILPNIVSLYHWNNKLEQAQEHQLIIKTSSHCFASLCELLKTHHPYDNPEIIELPIINCSPDYLTWIQKECQHA